MDFLANNAWFVALAAIAGVLATGWGYIKVLWERLTSYIVVNASLSFQAEYAMTLYCLKHFKRSTLGNRYYDSVSFFVRPIRRSQTVGYEVVGRSTIVYWSGWKPIWISKPEAKSDYSETGLKISFFRGTFQLDNLIIKAIDYFNKIQSDVSNGDRHYVKYIFGSGNKIIGNKDSNINSGDEDDDGGRKSKAYYDFRHNRLLKWEQKDLGPLRNSDDILSYLALSQDATNFIHEAKRWKNNEKWYNQHLVPWRLGGLFYGDPGNGKTAMARGIAEELDIPIFIYDLASLSNKEMKSAWNKMLQVVPCMAMIEDIDNVFHGRENIARTHGGGLTFDCLINCIDGIQRSDGLLLVITTNKIEHVDPAIGIPDINNQNASTRHGRIDRIIKMDKPDYDGKLKICRRILHGYDYLWEEILKAGENDSGASFQYRCSQAAFDIYSGVA